MPPNPLPPEFVALLVGLGGWPVCYVIGYGMGKAAVRPAPSEPAPIQSGGLIAFESETFRALPVGMEVRAEKWTPDERVRAKVARALYREIGTDLPRDDFWLRVRWLQGKARLSRAEADNLRAYVVAHPKMGYQTERGEVYIRRHRAREIVYHGMRLGRVKFG